MARGDWSFLHEWVIYDYLMNRYDEGTLRIKCRIMDGILLRREKWYKVEELQPITSSDFPDIKLIQLKGINKTMPAEIKFTTSLFGYHKGQHYKDSFDKFIQKKGFILVVNHDYIPKGLENKISVFELDKPDFISFCRENFTRLLNRQIKMHSETKVWIMYQGPNFSEMADNIKSGRESKIWCPTENLTSFDLATGDRILFVKTKGASTQNVQRNYLDGKILSAWRFSEMWIGEITSTINSRREYCQIKKFPYSTQLWKNDPKKNNSWRWNRVFSFKKIKAIKIDLSMNELYKNKQTKDFVEAVVEAFCYNKSREIPLEQYRNVLEYIT